jgi:membrane protease YdiL (CAAX protease family)
MTIQFILSKMDGKGWSPAGVVAVALALMVIAGLENTAAPWAPFYVGYAALATALPFAFGAVRLGRPARPRVVHLLVAVVLAAALHGAFSLITSTVDLGAMFGAVFSAASARLHRPPELIAARYLLGIQIWAGFGEEVFYRGYVQGQLRHRMGAAPAIAIASVLYAVRHYTQVLLAWPAVPWGAATVWVAACLLVGVALGVLYDRTRSLLPPVAAHTLFNLLA